MSGITYDRKNPFMATVKEAYCISEGSGKETNHYVISLKGSGIRYKPGDSLGFSPTNNYELVKKTIRKIGAKKKDTIEVKDGEETTLASIELERSSSAL
jgi:sulfite reductase (NADPH) flavoprotein alpha-component